jgi:hypothetical protein
MGTQTSSCSTESASSWEAFEQLLVFCKLGNLNIGRDCWGSLAGMGRMSLELHHLIFEPENAEKLELWR